MLVTSRWFTNQHHYYTALKLVQILQPIVKGVHWIVTEQEGGGYPAPTNGYTRIVIRDKFIRNSWFMRLVFLILHQMKVMKTILGLRKEADLIMFAFGADYFIFPMMVSKLCGYKVILRTDGRPSHHLKYYLKSRNFPLIVLYQVIEYLMYHFVDRIIIESKNFLDIFNLHDYRAKIYSGELFIDTALFDSKKAIGERSFHYGFVGRLSPEKGIMEFVQVLPRILQENQRGLIVGDGESKEAVERFLKDQGLSEKVHIPGWVEKESLPGIFNEIHMLIAPSHKEGLPNTILEAMACGCVVIATPVGGVPDVLDDGRTGFLIEGNSPEGIVGAVRRAGEADPNRISTNAHAFMLRHFTLQSAIERYANAIESLKYP